MALSAKLFKKIYEKKKRPSRKSGIGMKSIDLSQIDLGIDEDHRKTTSDGIGPTEISTDAPTEPNLGDTVDQLVKTEDLVSTSTRPEKREFRDEPVEQGLSVFGATNPLSQLPGDTQEGAQFSTTGHRTAKTNDAGTDLPDSSNLSGIVKGQQSDSNREKYKPLLVGLSVALILLSAVLVMDDSGDNTSMLMDLIGLSSDENEEFRLDELDEVSTKKVSRNRPKLAPRLRRPEVNKPKQEPQETEMINADGTLKNPYWPLPNRSGIKRLEGPNMTVELEQKWRFGLNHRYPARRYATVRDMRFNSRKGSEYLLFDALDQSKFWVRMEALLGLVEMGLEVDIETVEKLSEEQDPA